MFYEKELKALSKVNRFREVKLYDENLIDLASNDYLGLSSNKKLLKKAYKKVKKYKFNSSKSSLLVNGYTPIHKKFEQKLCRLNKFEDGIVVGSGFLANIALIESLVRKNDILFIDEQYHASGILATKLIDANIVFFNHNDYNDLKLKISKVINKKRIIIAIESVYSMGGDIAPKEFIDIANNYNAILIVDEAHSSGVIGKNLLGWFDYWDIKPKSNHIKMGTLGKAYGSYGAYILASKHIISYLENRAKSIIYTTAPSLLDISLAYESLKYIQKHKKSLRKKIKRYQNISNQILNIKTKSLILPIKLSSNLQAIQTQQNLISKGYLVGAIRQPTVDIPILRIILKLDISLNDIKKILGIIITK